MLSKLIKIVILVGLVLFVAYFGITVYGNFFMSSAPPGTIEMPEVNKAKYTFYIKNTGNILLTSEYEQFGDKAGERTFTLHGFWEASGQEFRYKERDLTITEQTFGVIQVKQRSVLK